MSVSDYRKLIDLHGGAFIGVECTDGVTIEVGINGDIPAKFRSDQVMSKVVPKLRARMEDLRGGFETFDFGFGTTKVPLNYYDAGLLLDSLIGCVRYIE